MNPIKTTLTLLLLTLLATPAISTKPQQQPTTILTQQQLLQQFLPKNASENFLGVPWETLSQDVEGLEFETIMPVPTKPYPKLERNTYRYSRPMISIDIGTGYESQTALYYIFDPYLGLSRAGFAHSLRNSTDEEFNSVVEPVKKFLFSNLRKPSDNYYRSRTTSGGKEIATQVYVWETVKNNRLMVLVFESLPPSSHPSNIGYYGFEIFPQEIIELMDAYALAQPQTQGKPFTFLNLKNIPWGLQPHEMEDLNYISKSENRTFYSRKTDSPVWQRIVLGDTLYAFDDHDGLKSVILLIDDATFPYVRRIKETISSQFGKPAPSSPYLTEQVYKFIDGWRTPNADIVMGRIRTGPYAIIFSEPIELPKTTIYEKIKNFFSPK